MTLAAASDMASFSHSHLVTATSSLDLEPSTITTDTGRVTLKSPPALAFGGIFWSVQVGEDDISCLQIKLPLTDQLQI